jgi:hypothetical protein
MATNFPTSLDTFTNPNSGNTLDSPSHSIQHSDINDAVEAIEAKIGVGSSTAGSATAGYALVNTSGGTTAYSLLGVSGLSSGTAVANTFLRANGSGAATFAPTAQGLTLLIPSSVAVGSGTGTVSATGTVDFSGVSSVSINDVFSATYQNYKVLVTGTGSGLFDMQIRLRVSGSDDSTSNSYVSQYIQANSTTVTATRATANSFNIGIFANVQRSVLEIDFFYPFTATPTNLKGISSSGENAALFRQTAGTHNQSTSYTGFTLFPSSGNITGEMSVYGYNK